MLNVRYGPFTPRERHIARSTKSFPPRQGLFISGQECMKSVGFFGASPVKNRLFPGYFIEHHKHLKKKILTSDFREMGKVF